MFVVVRQGSGVEDLTGHGIGGRLVSTVVEHRMVFLTAGGVPSSPFRCCGRVVKSSCLCGGTPIGLDVAQIGLVYGISSFVDAGLFYPSGYVMDRWGRKWASVPSLLTLTIGLLILRRPPRCTVTFSWPC